MHRRHCCDPVEAVVYASAPEQFQKCNGRFWSKKGDPPLPASNPISPPSLVSSTLLQFIPRDMVKKAEQVIINKTSEYKEARVDELNITSQNTNV